MQAVEGMNDDSNAACCSSGSTEFKVMLYSFRFISLLGFVALPGCMFASLFAWTYEYVAIAVLVSFLCLTIGLIPDLILICKATRTTSETRKSDEYGESTTELLHQKVVREKTKNSGVRCGLLYAQIIIPLVIAMAIAFFRFAIWNYKDASITMLYLPESTLDGTAMGIHVRIPVDEDETASFLVEYWPTDNPASKTQTAQVEFDVTITGGTGEIVLSDLDPNVQYTYEVALQRDAAGLFKPNKNLSGEFRSLPETTDDTLSFVTTSCAMFQMSLGRSTGIFNKLLGKGAQLGLFLGDFIYADVPFAEPVDEPDEVWRFRNRYRYMMSQNSVNNALGEIPFAFMFDDHEIVDNFEAPELTPQYTSAISEWRAFVGGRNPRTSNEATSIVGCVDAATADTFNNSTELEIEALCNDAFLAYQKRITFASAENYDFTVGPARFFVLDTRRFRSGSVITGPEQTAQVVQWIQDATTETVSFVVSPAPWTLNNPGGWKCCEPERDLILDAAVAAKSAGKTIVFVSGDQHRPGIYELRPGIFEVSASPLDSTTTSWVWLDPRLQNDDTDNTLYEEAGFNHVFALWNVNATSVSVDIYAGGRDLSVVVTLCFIAGFLVVGVLAFLFLKSNKKEIAVVCVLLLIGLLVGVFVSEFSLDKPRFTFSLDR